MNCFCLVRFRGSLYVCVGTHMALVKSKQFKYMGINLSGMLHSDVKFVLILFTNYLAMGCENDSYLIGNLINEVLVVSPGEIRNVVIVLAVCEVILCYPQSIRIPDIKNKAPPEEINELAQHRQYPRSIETHSSSKSHNNVEATIKEVEDMIKANPTLPRLTRGEILDLLENITRTDMAKSTSGNDNVKDRDPKAIMVVMPYTPSNSNDNNMEELFTKPPVTHIIGADPFKKTPDTSNSKPNPAAITDLFDLGKVKKPAVEKDKSFRGNMQYQKKTSTSTTTTGPTSTASTFTEQSTHAEKKPNHRRRRPQKQTTEETKPLTERPTVPLTTYHPKGRRPVRRRPTTTEKHPNHKYPDETTTEAASPITPLPSTGIRIIDPPKFPPTQVNDDLYAQEDQTGDVFVKKATSQPFNSTTDKHQVPIPVVATKQNAAHFSLTDLVPDHLKGVLEDMNPEQLTSEDRPKSSLPTKLSSAKEEENIKNILSSLGVRPSKVTTTTTTTSVPDVSNVADNLSPEMRDLLMSFGLIPNPQDTAVAASEVVDSYNPVKAEVKAESYVGFKPLPDDQSSRHEMEELLAQFGLGKSSRREKSLPKKKNEQLTFDAVPEQFKGVLEDIGLTDRQGKMIKAEPLVKTLEKGHVFSPVDKQYASNEELEKLNKLLNVVKQLEKLNGTVTDEDLKKIDVDNLKELVSSLNEETKIVPLDEQSAPNPVNYDYGLNKNDVKRQQNSTSTTPPTPATTTTTQPSPTTTEETIAPNIKDLEDSFGGQTDADPATSTAAPETTTPTRKTGFYYLVDWNTLLDIDDQKGKRVNLRFQPTIGDPKRFYSVTVP